MKRATIIIVSLLVVLALIFVLSRWSATTTADKTQTAPSVPTPAKGDSQSSSAESATPSGPPATAEEGRSATEAVTRMVSSFHTRMKENPVGTNAEITKALMGGNPVHATFTDETPRLNSKGELLDPWGTPYFFHQVSGNEMEVHSAGPDKIMGTADDIIEN